MNDDRSPLVEHGRTMWWLGAVSGFMVGTVLTGIAYAILEGFR